MGRWAWSSDALDFDNDGFDDLFIVNGMFTRGRGELDYDSFFWREVVGRSPLTDKGGTSYDDAWRAINRLLMAEGTQAPHERKVLLRNNGRGGFDEVSGSVGLDLDQDGRSFAVFDYDQDGDPDLVLMSPRSSPQLRIFRNDFGEKNASIALRLTGTKSNRDAVGAWVTVETDVLKRTKLLQGGSGFISQHSKELLFGLGRSTKVVRLVIHWPSGEVQTLEGLPVNERISVTEGNATVREEPFKRRSVAREEASIVPTKVLPGSSWLLRPFPAPEFSLRDLEGHEHALSDFRGRPGILLFWATWAPPSLRVLQELGGRLEELKGAPVLAISLDSPNDEEKVRAASAPGVPVAIASQEVSGPYSILHRYLYDHREDLRLPTLLLIDRAGQVVKVGHEVSESLASDLSRTEVSPDEALARAVPFKGTFYQSPGERSYFQYALELSEQGFDRAATKAFELAAKLDPNPITYYNLGTLYATAGEPAQGRLAFERALSARPDYPEASNSLGALLAQGGDLQGALAQFRKALSSKPDFPDALNNMGYALFQAGEDKKAYDLYQKALALQPEFPEAFNNLGIYFGKAQDLQRAESFFRKAVQTRPNYGEASNNLALVLNARGDEGGAIRVLEALLSENPGFEPGYLTLARLHAGAGRTGEAISVLERSPKTQRVSALLQELRGY
jgi:Tfp pilus assembly protein PilF/peroxiredoxin